VVNGLLAHRERGRWGNTQENTFVLLALDRYFRTFESVTPDFVARFWLGEEYVAEHTYVGRTTERNETLVPMDFLVD
jgi:alpha-2-macroglobulin